MKVAVIDYKAGNLLNAVRAFQKLGASAEPASSARQLCDADALVLPGQGAFSCMRNLSPMRQTLLDELASGKPFMGICLGLQLLFEKSAESPGVKGLGLFKGKVRRLNASPLPHMGWNQVENLKGSLFDGIEDESYFYFIHSYVASPRDASATCFYGEKFAAAVERRNIFATQFHPERSAEAGLLLLKNFLQEARR